MVATPQPEVGTDLASILSTVSTEAVPAPIHQQGIHAITARTILFGIGDRSGEPLRLLRVPSVWDGVLVAVLFLLISALVGLRVADVLSERDIELSSLPSVIATAGTADESVHASADDRRAYESYLSPETPPRLLSDEGKVVRLLVANNGRIHQHRIADETGWSKSKVSRICSRMHADGTIEKQSVGRENVIIFADRPDDDGRSDDVENPLP